VIVFLFVEINCFFFSWFCSFWNLFYHWKETKLQWKSVYS